MKIIDVDGKDKICWMINNPSITQSLCFKKLQILLFPIILSIPHDVYCSTVYLCTYEHFVFFGYYNIFLVSDSPAHDPLCTVEVQTVRDFTTLTKNTQLIPLLTLPSNLWYTLLP